DESAIANELAITGSTEPALEKPTSHDRKAKKAAAPLDPIATKAVEPSSEATAPQIATKLVLEVKGPAEQVEAFLEAIRDKRIQLPPIELLVRDI
ncbi:MAG: hypothetical protein JRJ05_02560, partial [Deltaproteobacteria bacterium]|nr:hypothetical protein [Deltaproteobacteria bacterium]